MSTSLAHEEENMNDSTRKIEVIREILSWTRHDDDTKHYFIKSFLLGWTDEEYIHGMTARQ